MKGRKRKRSATHHYTTAVKTAFGKHALQFGNKIAVVKNSKELGFELPETTVINFKRELGQQLKSGKDYGELDITNRKRGRPLLLPAELDDLTRNSSLAVCVYADRRLIPLLLIFEHVGSLTLKFVNWYFISKR